MPLLWACTSAGTAAEMVCPGGELAFVMQMVEESEQLQDRVHWWVCVSGVGALAGGCSGWWVCMQRVSAVTGGCTGGCGVLCGSRGRAAAIASGDWLGAIAACM